ncbi:MAG: cytochrome C biogenesis protein [Haloferacaceae archaeon]
MTALEVASLTGFAFVAGALTFFAPCAYPLLPGYVSYYLGESVGSESAGRRPATDGSGVVGHLPGRVAHDARLARVARAVVVGGVVSVGFFVVYGLLAGAVVAFGSRRFAGISLLELVVGVVLVVAGAAMATGRSVPTPTVRLPERRRSVAGYLGFGVLYAAAAAGCTAPLFVGVAIEALSAGAGVGVAVLVAYASGMSALMIGVTVATALGRDAVLSAGVRRADLVRRIAGVLLVAAGAVEIYLFLFRFGGLALLGL